MSRDEYQYRLLLAGGIGLLVMSVFGLLTDSAFVGFVFVAATIVLVEAVKVMPEGEE